MKNIILIFGVLIIAGAGFYIYNQSSSAELILGGDTGASEAALANAQVYIERSAQLDALTLDTEVLDDPLFTSLQSYTKPLIQYPVGRTNPFAEPVSTR